MRFDTYILISSFVLGACIGSFLNVCIYRLPRRCLRIWRPAFSFCPTCQRHLHWYENIPLASYILQGGKCRGCRQTIPLRYFVVELLTAILFLMCADRILLSRGGPDWALYAVVVSFGSALVVCSFVDMDLRIIPDDIDKPGMPVAVLLSALVPRLHPALELPDIARWVGSGTLEDWAGYAHLQGAVASVMGIAAGAGLIWFLGWAGERIFRKEAMGLGDVKFMGMIGGFLGWKGMLLALVVACLAGASVGVVRLIFVRDRYIPFGPFLSIGAFALLVFRPEVMRFFFDTWPRFVQPVARPVLRWLGAID